MKYYGGCDSGSTYTKCVIIDETGKMVADVTLRSRINAVLSCEESIEKAVAQVPDLKSADDLAYLVGTGYGRNKVPSADENISEISCHAMGVHVADPNVKAIIDIGGQDVKGIAIDADGTVLNFAMNDKCAAGTGRFFEAMAKAFEMDLSEFSKLSLKAKNVIPITAQCTVFAESEVISLVGVIRCKALLRYVKEGRCCRFHHFDRWMCQERRLEGSHRKGIEFESHRSSDRPTVDGSTWCGRVCTSKGNG